MWLVPGVPHSREGGLGSLQEAAIGMGGTRGFPPSSPARTSLCLGMPHSGGICSLTLALSAQGKRARSTISSIFWLRRLAFRNVREFAQGHFAKHFAERSCPRAQTTVFSTHPRLSPQSCRGSAPGIHGSGSGLSSFHREAVFGRSCL